MKADATCIALISGFEGLRLAPYDDADGAAISFVNREWRRPDGAKVLGWPTIGWGHVILPTETFTAITRADADALLLEDLGPRVAFVNRQIPDETPGWNQHRFNACVSFTYNAGTGGFLKSGIPDACKAGRFDDCKPMFMAYVHSKGVVNQGLIMRRAKEWGLFSEPMPADPIDAAAVLAKVYATASQVVGEFAALPLADRPTVPDPSDTAA